MGLRPTCRAPTAEAVKDSGQDPRDVLRQLEQVLKDKARG